MDKRICKICLIVLLSSLLFGACNQASIDHLVEENESKSNVSSDSNQMISESFQEDPICQSYEDLRKLVDYPGLAPIYSSNLIPHSTSSVDNIGKELENFLNYVAIPEKEILDVTDWDNDQVLLRILENATYLCYTRECTGEKELFVPELQPIAEAVNDDSFILKEHVEAAARDIYGENMILEHHSIMGGGLGWIWHEEEGVYTPPHIGLGMPNIPHIFQYTNMEESYIVEVTYYKQSSVENEMEMSRDKIANMQPRLQYEIQRNSDGHLIVVHVYFLDDALD